MQFDRGSRRSERSRVKSGDRLPLAHGPLSARAHLPVERKDAETVLPRAPPSDCPAPPTTPHAELLLMAAASVARFVLPRRRSTSAACVVLEKLPTTNAKSHAASCRISLSYFVSVLLGYHSTSLVCFCVIAEHAVEAL